MLTISLSPALLSPPAKAWGARAASVPHVRELKESFSKTQSMTEGILAVVTNAEVAGRCLSVSRNPGYTFAQKAARVRFILARPEVPFTEGVEISDDEVVAGLRAQELKLCAASGDTRDSPASSSRLGTLAVPCGAGSTTSS